MVEIKFCGVTRAADAAEAAALGASYVGVIFAGGPRLLTPAQASTVFAALPATVRRVGVFAARPAAEIGAVAREVGLHVVQLHGDPTARTVEELRAAFSGEIWAVSRIADGQLPASLGALFHEADAVVLDALVRDRLGGSGVTLPWAALAPAIDQMRQDGRVVLAGGLRPDNVAEAIGAIAPEVVDVSSGVESAPGIKDHARMRAFRDAVLASLSTR